MTLAIQYTQPRLALVQLDGPILNIAFSQIRIPPGNGISNLQWTVDAHFVSMTKQK